MPRRKDGTPRVVVGENTTAPTVAGRPYIWTSLYCRHDEHEKCLECPSCECHVPVSESITAPLPPRPPIPTKRAPRKKAN